MNSPAKDQAAPRRRAPAEKRRFLLKAARDLFVEQGFEATTTKQIAEQAGVSEGILFHQFGSKVGLFSKLVEEFIEKGKDQFMAVQDEGSPSELLIRSAFAFSEKDRPLFQLIYNSGDILKANGIPTLRVLIVPAIEERLRTAIDKGFYYKGNPAIMAEIQFSIVEATYIAWLRSNTDQEKDEVIAEGVRCLDAVNAKSSG